jgi:uncharacterized protein
MSYVEREKKSGPKRLLSIDGGGLRGVLSLQILAKIERLLREHRGNDELVLADEFDYIAGTSTGAIIASGLSMGMSVQELDDLYSDLATRIFTKRLLPLQAWSKYKDGPLKTALRNTFSVDGRQLTFGDPELRTLLLCVLHNSSTDSPWPLSNCSTAKYNDRRNADCNLNIPLWQVIRGSTAAPLFFPPEEIRLGGRKFTFQDGGVTPYNNPAFIQFVMATAPQYGLEWATGADQLLSVSVGTGLFAAAQPSIDRIRAHVARNLPNVIAYLMNSASAEQDRLCRLVGDCRFGAEIDGEVGDLIGPDRALPPAFSYVRYNADISQRALDATGFSKVRSTKISKLDAVDSLEHLRNIGIAAADQVELSHFEGFV